MARENKQNSRESNPLTRQQKTLLQVLNNLISFIAQYPNLHTRGEHQRSHFRTRRKHCYSWWCSVPDNNSLSFPDQRYKQRFLASELVKEIETAWEVLQYVILHAPVFKNAWCQQQWPVYCRCAIHTKIYKTYKYNIQNMAKCPFS